MLDYQALSVKLRGREDRVNKLLGLFSNSFDESMQSIDSAASEQDANKMMEACHKIKGSLFAIECSDEAALFGDMEAKSREGTPLDETEVSELKQAMESVAGEINNILH